jgi:hypothetical protein
VGWNPAAHPRYPNGRFKPKFSQSVRVSPISVSYNAGIRVPIVPGRANLYVGALARVERSGGNTFLKRQTDSIVNKVFGKLGDEGGQSNLAQLLKGNELNINGMRVVGPSNVINTPSFRVSSTPASRDAVKRAEANINASRRQRRRPPSGARGRYATSNRPIKTSEPKAIPMRRKRAVKRRARR